MINALGKVLIELRDDVLYGTWCSQRVRGQRPGTSDAQGPTAYIRFAVVSILTGPRLPRAPVAFPRYLVRSYGVDDEDAMTGYGYASDALHNIGTRVHGTTGIYNSIDVSGPEPGEDPRTAQPYVDVEFSFVTLTQAVA